eukprot:2957790-Amphidinium_carterae.1
MQSSQMPYMPPGMQQQQMQLMPQPLQSQPQAQVPPQQQPQQSQSFVQPAQTMQDFRQPAPTFQSAAASASANPYDLETLWNRLLPGQYGALIPMFRNDEQQRDIRELQDNIPKVITFLEAWENVPKNHQPKWYKDALANYSVISAANEAPITANTVRVLLPTTYNRFRLRPVQVPPIYNKLSQLRAIKVLCQLHPPQQQRHGSPIRPTTQSSSRMQIQQPHLGRNHLSKSQAQSSNWQGSSYQSSNAQQPYWSSSQYSYGGQYKQNSQQGRCNYEALRDGNFPKANFTPGKTHAPRMKPRARQE